jgi:hypothetical protein
MLLIIMNLPMSFVEQQAILRQQMIVDVGFLITHWDNIVGNTVPQIFHLLDMEEVLFDGHAQSYFS